MTDATGDPTLPDGTYDAMVVDAAGAEDGTVAVELTIVAGPAKGEVVALSLIHI